MARSVPGILDTLCASLAAIFDQVQGSLANHRKNCVALHKLHMQASAATESNANGQAVKLVGERLFKDLFIEMVDRMLVVKKGPAAADRVVKFLGAYVKYLNEKGASMSASRSSEMSPHVQSLRFRLVDKATTNPGGFL